MVDRSYLAAPTTIVLQSEDDGGCPLRACRLNVLCAYSLPEQEDILSNKQYASHA